MKLEDYKAWLLEHGEITEEYERPYNPYIDPPEYKEGSYFVGYNFFRSNGELYAGFAVGDITAEACYQFLYNECKELFERGF